MKIILGIEDIKKLIMEHYNGINEIDVSEEKVDYTLDVDGDKFSKKSSGISNSNTANTAAGPIDFDAKLAEKQALRQEITGDAIPGKVKSLEERNAEAAAKGLMTSGRGSARPLAKF